MTGRSPFALADTEESIGTRLSIEETMTGRQRLTISRNLEHHPIAFSSPDGALAAGSTLRGRHRNTK